MSSPPTEPTPQGNAASVRTEETYDAGQNHPPRRPPTGQKQSSSLLSKLLSPTNESHESRMAPDRTDISKAMVVRAGANVRSTSDNEVSVRSHTSTTDTMAATISPMRIPPRSLGSSPAFGFSSHREPLNGWRGRGTSLERTHKEKMVEELPKLSFSTNPGDTGILHPPAATNSGSGSSISDNPPIDGVRAKYRSWRDPRLGIAVEKTWSIGKQSSADVPEGQVEKSIADVLAGVEPNNRSRKASHSVRLFREGLPEEKPKKRENKDGARSKDKSPRLKEVLTSDDNFGSGSGVGDSSKSDNAPSPLQPRDEDRNTANKKRGNSLTVGTSLRGLKLFGSDYTESPQDYQPLLEERPNALPAQLLDDLRKRHNLTPAAAKGLSFSGSLRVIESERHTSDEKRQELSLPKTPFFNKVTEGSPVKNRSDEDDDSGEEQISSALFVPHQTSHKSHDSTEQETSEQDSPHEKKSLRRYSDAKPEEWLVEHDVPLRTANKSPAANVVHKQLSPVTRDRISPRQEQGYFPELLSSTETPSYDTYSDAGYFTKGEEESSLTDDPGTTPTGTGKGEHFMSENQKDHLHRHQQVAKAPLDAIELIPYRHQVGGHTTMWRFSKRAVCKQLNNRENEFYEKVERDHPRLLKFMPRYIGVLNVTFEKQQKRKVTVRDENGISNEGDGISHSVSGELVGNQSQSIAQNSTKQNSQIQSDPVLRVISQSVNPAQVPTPTVTFADNRHIIPKSFMQPQLQQLDRRLRALRDNSAIAVSPIRRPSQSQPPLPNSEFTFRPTLSDKHAASWGATTVNKKLRNEVFGEAFLQQPIPIHRHKKPAHQNRPLSHRAGNSKAQGHLRNSNSESSLITAQQTQSDSAAKADGAEESMRRRAMKGAAGRNGLTPLTPIHPSEEVSHLQSTTQSSELVADRSEVEFEEKAGTSAPEADIPAETQMSKRKRRYSSGGLRRKPEAVEDARGNLKYYEEADDAGYKGDGEDDIFKMDTESSTTTAPPSVATDTPSPVLESIAKTSIASAGGHDRVGTMLPAARNEKADDVSSIPRPVNPKEAQTQPDKRVEFFLLLEDLTAGMKRPCIMDLKMGTRQYGVDANEAKQLSQRRKCAETTSKELGVRVCGLQVWDVASQSYIFRDKYFGRDLKAGREFQDALVRFLYDGVDNSSILRHIPTILHKLSQLEILIKHLRGYRFYAASLLMFYDGGVEDETASNTDTSANERENELKSRGREIDFKIADFANCVTAEMAGEALKTRPCPPKHPDQPDKGFLRGLRSLRAYFLSIQKEIIERDGGRKGKGKSVNYSMNGNETHDGFLEDFGEVSY